MKTPFVAGPKASVEANRAFATWVSAQVMTAEGRADVVFALSLVGRTVIVRGDGPERKVTVRGARPAGKCVILPVAALKFNGSKEVR